MKRNKTRAFSLLEVMAALVILAVVGAATFATVAPMRSSQATVREEQELVLLNSLAEAYRQKEGKPAQSLGDLVQAGYLSSSDPISAARLNDIERRYVYSETTGQFTAR